MTIFTWKSGVSGDWSLASDWSQGAVPNAVTADVTISAPGSYQVSIASGESFAADSVTLDSNGATLGIGGFLNLGGSNDQLVVNAGLLTVGSTGTIANGTIAAGGGTISFVSGAALEDVTYKGNLKIASGQRLDVYGGLAVETASGGLPGTISVADGGVINYEANQTLSHQVINLGSSAGGSGLYYDLFGSGGTLTLGSGFTLNSTGTGNQIFNDSGNGGILNDGVINVNGSELGLTGNEFANAGTINVTAGATLEVTASTFTNNAKINVSGTLDLDTDVTLASLNGVSASGAGVILFADVLDLGGGTLTITGTDNYQLGGSGTIANGTIAGGGGTISFVSGATLDDVTYKGNLKIASGQRLDVYGGLAVETATGGLPGTISIADGGVINYEGSQTLSNQVINLGSSAGGSGLYYDLFGSGGTLTLGSGVVLNSTGTGDQIFNDSGDGGILNDGVINVNSSELSLTGNEFANAGTVKIAAGATLEVTASTFTNSAKINVSGTLDLDTGVTLASLAGISASGAGVILFADVLDLGGGTLTITGSDNYQVSASGTIANGTIAGNAGTISLASGAALEDVTYKGNLKIASGQRLDIYGGLTVETGAGGLPGTISVADGGVINYEANQTVSHQVINLGSSAGGSGLYYDLFGSGGTLTLGSGFILNSTGTGDQIYNDSGNGGILNDGIININGSELGLTGNEFANAGTINVAAGAVLEVTASTFTNSAKINVKGTLDLDTDVTLATLHGISASAAGVILIADVLDLGGGTLTITGTDNYQLGGSGTIANGTIAGSGGTISFASGATLDDVTYKGNLKIASGQRLDVYGGLAVETATGGLPGTISVADGGVINYEASQSLSHQVINLGSSAGNAGLYYDLLGSGGTLTLGSSVTLNSTGAGNQIYNDSGNGGILNDGIININGSELGLTGSEFANAGSLKIAAGATLEVTASTFSNSGLIEGSGTGTASVAIATSTFTNFAAGKLTGGTFEASAGNTLALNLNGLITNDSGTLILNSAGSEIELYQSSTSSYVSLESMLGTIGSTGKLEILNGDSYTSAKTLVDSGKIVLGGGKFASAGLTVNGGASFAGFGTLAASVINNGSIIGSGSTLSLMDSISGTGIILIGTDTDVVLGAGIGAGQKIKFGGTDAILTLDMPTEIGATLVSLAPSNTIDLVGEIANSATIIGSKLVVSLTAGGTIGYTLASPNAMDKLATVSDGHGGSYIVVDSAKASLAPTTIHGGGVNPGFSFTSISTDDGHTSGTIALPVRAVASGATLLPEAYRDVAAITIATTGRMGFAAPAIQHAQQSPAQLTDGTQPQWSGFERGQMLFAGPPPLNDDTLTKAISGFAGLERLSGPNSELAKIFSHNAKEL